MDQAHGQPQQRKKMRCTVCQSHQLLKVVELPQLPLTGIYVRGHARDREFAPIDQALMLCAECGHGQLLFQVDPNYLYGASYLHRGSTSPSARGVNEFFAAWLTQLAPGRVFARVLDVGCGDLYLLKAIAGMGERLLGVDPVWRGKDHQVNEKITVRGGFIEDFDAVDELGGPPDLIVSAHTFEHIDEARLQLERLMAMAAPGALFVVEVPSFDSLLASLRFDQVFHQHVNYYSVASFQRLIAEIGATYVSHTHNYNFWNGTLLMAFRKPTTTRFHGIVAEPLPHAPTAAIVTSRFDIWREQMALLRETIATVREPIFGFGAAQILPMLAYHLQNDLSFLDCIWDDNPNRHGLNYPSLPVPIVLPSPGLALDHAAVLITALDSVRPIMQRLAAFKPRRIVVPLNCC